VWGRGIQKRLPEGRAVCVHGALSEPGRNDDGGLRAPFTQLADQPGYCAGRCSDDDQLGSFGESVHIRHTLHPEDLLAFGVYEGKGIAEAACL
jgi:hypothetical protein